MPYFIKNRVNIEENCGVKLFTFESLHDDVGYSMDLFDCQVLLSKSKLNSWDEIFMFNNFEYSAQNYFLMEFRNDRE